MHNFSPFSVKIYTYTILVVGRGQHPLLKEILYLVG